MVLLRGNAESILNISAVHKDYRGFVLGFALLFLHLHALAKLNTLVMLNHI